MCVCENGEAPRCACERDSVCQARVCARAEDDFQTRTLIAQITRDLSPRLPPHPLDATQTIIEVVEEGNREASLDSVAGVKTPNPRPPNPRPPVLPRYGSVATAHFFFQNALLLNVSVFMLPLAPHDAHAEAASFAASCFALNSGVSQKPPY